MTKNDIQIKRIRMKYFYFFSLLTCLNLFALESEDLEKVKSLLSVVESGNRYVLNPIELFDGDVPWRIVRGSSFQESARFVSKFPNTESYNLELKMFYPNSDNSKQLKSLQIHSNIEIPGRDKVFVTPEIAKPIEGGVPVRIFFWVHSNNYDINLKVFLAHKKNKDIIIDFGSLKFNGWRRMESRVTIQKPLDRLNLSRLNLFELKGILLESSKFQSKGSFHVLVDQMGILLEKPQAYPGSEVPDGWELY